MKNRNVTITAILSGVVLLSAAMLGGQRLLDIIPFATSSEHMELAGEVEGNKVAILENTRDDLERAIQTLLNQILAIDLAQLEMQSKDMDLPPHVMIQRVRLE